MFILFRISETESPVIRINIPYLGCVTSHPLDALPCSHIPAVSLTWWNNVNVHPLYYQSLTM